MNQFYVGQEVVCLRAAYDPQQKTTITPELVEGQVYRIRWIGIYNHYLDGEYLGIRVEGIDRGICPFWGYDDQPFRADRFRPLVADRLGSLRALLVPGQPLAPSIEEPRRGPPSDGGERVKEKEEELV
ncbi:hypothetical protein BTE77_06505 [Ensifer adhaerens]|nr:hypothetical protein BTE77_06505 [Ensifer adhaerens]